MRLIFLPTKVAKCKGGRGRAAFRLIDDARGATAIEYTLIAALIALVFVALITEIGDFVSIPFETVASRL